MQEENRTLKKSNKTLKKKTILHKRKNKTLKKKAILHEREIARLRKSLEQKDKDLDLERSLWNGRKTEWDSGAGTDLHRIEVFDGIISDESSLHSATMRSMEEFKYILEHVKAYATAYNEMPLFCDDESRASDPGNRCKLRLRHALLLVLVRKKNNPAQGTLQAIFGVDQSSVCRYLQVMDQILATVLSTTKNISEEITACKTKEGFKKRVSGPSGGNVFVDGTHCPVQRPSEKTVRRMRYSGKKKWFTNNTNVYTNADGVIIRISKSSVGSTGDIALLREDPMPFGRWAESMHDGSILKEDRIRIWADRGY